MAVNNGGYVLLFAFSLAMLGYVYHRTREQSTKAEASFTPEFKAFQRNYLMIYLVMTSADWIQGPYVYKLYSYYGFNKGEIGFLFVAGFCSSAIFGTFVGGMADRLGRKRTCLLFGVLYSFSCMTKHISVFNVLLLGRILGGISTSILFSVFETWMMHEHRKAAYPDEWLVNTFSLTTFGSGAVAIASGVVASIVAEKWGFVAPFDVAILLLVVGSFMVYSSWSENYGDQALSPGSNFAMGWLVLASNSRVWLLGLIQSSFEGAMYVFVFSWTPTLEESVDDEAIPHGWIFTSFMVAIMVGSHLFKVIEAEKRYSTQDISRITMVSSIFTLLLPGLISNHWFALLSFFAFEVCVGIYFPSMAYQRAKHIPNEVRATVMNFFRIPLNVLVVVALLNVGSMDTLSISFYCAGLLAIAAGAQTFLNSLDAPQSSQSKPGHDVESDA